MTAQQAVPVAQLVPVSALTPAPWNPRRISDARFQSLCNSVEADPDFLWLRPILATADGTVYGGNMRLRAAIHLGMSQVPAVVLDVPEQLAKERALRDNNGWGEWEDADLSSLLEELRSGTPDWDATALGFDDKFLDKLLAEMLQPEDDTTSRSQNPFEPRPDRTFVVYVDPAKWDETLQLAERVGVQLGTTTISDTVLGALRACDAS